jgi:hypothetical protein
MELVHGLPVQLSNTFAKITPVPVSIRYAGEYVKMLLFWNKMGFVTVLLFYKCLPTAYI